VIRNTIAAALLVALAACQTAYQDMGFTGGVSAQPITADTWRISARGNGFTDQTTVQDYVLLKAAETTIAAGLTHFVLLQAADASSAGVISTPGSAQTTFIGNTAFTTWTPGYTDLIVKPGSDVIIKLVPKDAAPPPRAMDARQIVQFIGSRVERA
jgi:hypothetical protein